MAENLAHLSQTFTVVPGKSKRLKFPVRRRDEDGNDLGPYDLTGKDVRLAWTSMTTGGRTEKAATVDSPETDGIVRVTMLSSETIDIAGAKTTWLLFIEASGGENDDPLAGGMIKALSRAP